MSDDRRKHPSGKPIRPDRETRIPVLRCPYDEPLTPGLRRKTGTPAIGFRAVICRDDDDYDMRRRR
jgi:hypothetical protein